MDPEDLRRQSVIKPELYFLIAKFLDAGPLTQTAEVLRRELEIHKILPKRLDWEGNSHERTFQELERQYGHIDSNHLLQICSRIGPILDKEIPPVVPGVTSLLGAGKQSLLRTTQPDMSYTQLVNYAVRAHHVPLLEPPFRNLTHNIVKVLIGREFSGPQPRRLLVSSQLYTNLQLLRRTLGHLSAVYCVLFDRTGRYIATGADDLLVKLWSAIDGRLLGTFRGASAEITDIAVNIENTLLAAGSLDRILRVWDLQTMAPIAVLSGHTGMITSVNFCPSTRWDVRYLVTTSTDGSVAFWTYTHTKGNKAQFMSKPISYHERMRPGQAQMICASFSPGGTFLAAGSADHHVRVYKMHGDEGPQRILETEAHTDTVDSIAWAHRGLRFISGSKDGTAHIWHFESQQWKSYQLLMGTKLPGVPENDEAENKKLKVTMVSWMCSDNFVVTAVNDHSLKVWIADTGKLYRVLTGHKDEVYVLESHPKDPRVLLSAGHDGYIFIWDILTGDVLALFVNNIEEQGHGAVFDAKWSPIGTSFAATDSHGHILTFDFGTGHKNLKLLPKELFFHTDYRPLVRDSNHWVLDEQTQTAPNLMPPPFLVDIDGNPYPPALQRLVPGRENCQVDQLIPNIAVSPSGVQEVIEGLPSDEPPRSDIDRMIQALAQRQYGGEPSDRQDAEPAPREEENLLRQIASPRSGHRTGMRRNGDIEGVRQTSGNWQRDDNYKWNYKKCLVKPLNIYELKAAMEEIEALGQTEIDQFRREMRRRPVMITIKEACPTNRSRTRRGRNRVPAYRTRAVRSEQLQEQQDNDQDNQPNPNDDDISSSSSDSDDSTAVEEDLKTSSSSETESSGYSDWVADHHTLEPPKRSKRKPVGRKPVKSVTLTSDEEKKRPVRTKKVHQTKLIQGEIPELFRPPDWLSEVIPKKAPYYPQMGDEIMYFRQGHQLYIDAVKNKNIYQLGPRSVPWTKMNIKAHELVKVVGIKYEIRPPRLCCLKLALMNRNGRLTGEDFAIKYHDMADVLDFLVLKQTYDLAMTRNWVVGDRFRCMIDDSWWLGEIVSQAPINPDFPDSLFMCYRVKWDNGEYEQMSPWDLEPVNEDRLPTHVGGAVPVLPEEIQATLYQPGPEEWPRGDREATCRRIIAGLDVVMSLAIAEPFVAPVDLNRYPSYAFVIEYPIDISTIKARFENHFYRRITSAQFDVRYLATNAEKFNESHSPIVRHARIVTELCLRILKSGPDEVDVGALYHQLVDTYESSDSEVDVGTDPQPSTSTAGPSVVRTRFGNSSIRRSTRTRKFEKSSDWQMEARVLLETLYQCEDSAPFREPVDRLEHPDYYQMIDTPMDLLSIKEDLLGGNYESPLEFCKDMRLIFQNSRNFNTNKRSRIYSMTIRISAMFEEHMRRIMYNWKSARRREGFDKRRNKRLSSRKRNGQRSSAKRNSSDEEDEDEDDNITVTSSSPTRKNTTPRKANVITNGHASTSRASGSATRVATRQIQKNRNKSQDSEEDSEMQIDSEDSYRPNSNNKGKKIVRRNKKGRRKQKKLYCGESDLSDISKRTRAKTNIIHQSDSDSEDDSDNEPLVNCVTNNTTNNVTSNVKYNQDTNSEENSDEDNDNDNNQNDSQEEEEEDEEIDEPVISHRLRSSHDETSQSSSRPTRTTKRSSLPKSWLQNEDESSNEDDEEEEEEVVVQTAKPTPNPLRSVRKKRNQTSSESENTHLAPRSARAKRFNYRKMLEFSDDSNAEETNGQRTRRGKRPIQYNEDSDNSGSNNNNNNGNRRKRRNVTNDNDSDSNNERSTNVISISSRGRIRKLTPRAKAFLRD